MRILRALFPIVVMIALIYGMYQFIFLPFLNPTVTVAHVIDGDTLLVKNGKKLQEVQLIGVDAPEEVGQYNLPQCFSKEARHTMAQYLAKNPQVRLAKDDKLTDKDTVGRLLRYVYLKNGELLNEKVLKDGLARQFITLNVKYKFQDQMAKYQTEAQQKGLGVWNPEGCRGVF